MRVGKLAKASETSIWKNEREQYPALLQGWE